MSRKQIIDKKESFKPSVERTFQGIRVSTVHDGYYVHQHYIGYSQKEAVELFKQYLNEV